MLKWWKVSLLILAVICAGGGVVVGSGHLRLHFTGHDSGIFLLKGEKGSYTLADDLYLGEEDRLLQGFDFAFWHRIFATQAATGDRVAVELDWNERDGEGVIVNHLGGKRELRTHFSRYQDSNNLYTHGLFIGGAMASELIEQQSALTSNSGMSYYDGSSWRHIWCNTNEGIGSTVSNQSAAPSGWIFLGSRILRSDAAEVRLVSDHRLVLDGVPLAIEREVTVEAGDPFVQLTIRITNRGEQTARYFYFYGDEPWVGDFGSSDGDVGWLPERPVYFEESIDPQRYNFVGMMDAGNRMLGEGPGRTPVANFIEWRSASRPDDVYFANNYRGYDHAEKVRVPLRGNSRSVGLLWETRVLDPGATQTIELVVGMADFDPVRGLPRRPQHYRPAFATAVKGIGPG